MTRKSITKYLACIFLCLILLLSFTPNANAVKITQGENCKAVYPNGVDSFDDGEWVIKSIIEGGPICKKNGPTLNPDKTMNIINNKPCKVKISGVTYTFRQKFREGSSSGNHICRKT